MVKLPLTTQLEQARAKVKDLEAKVEEEHRAKQIPLKKAYDEAIAAANVRLKNRLAEIRSEFKARGLTFGGRPPKD